MEKYSSESISTDVILADTIDMCHEVKKKAYKTVAKSHTGQNRK